MEVFKVQTAYDRNGNSDWDALWYGGDDGDLEVLLSEIPLFGIWKPPVVQLQRRNQRPDMYVFQLYYAVTDQVRKLLLPLVGDNAEFLPLSIPGRKRPLFVLHPLLRADLSAEAVVSCNSVSGNIGVIRKYCFDLDQFREPMPIFQVRHPVGSAARNGGLACSGVFVSREVMEVCVKEKVRGIVFVKVAPGP